MKATARLLMVWLALMGLLALSVGVWHLHLGAMGTALGLAIAGLKAGLVVAFFMHLREESSSVHAIAGAVGFWLALLFGLTLADLFTR